MFNENFIWGFVLADRERKRLEDKGAPVSKNFSMKYALLNGVSNMPVLPALMLSDEVNKIESPIFENAKTEIAKLEERNQELLKFIKSLPTISGIGPVDQASIYAALTPEIKDLFNTDLTLKDTEHL